MNGRLRKGGVCSIKDITTGAEDSSFTVTDKDGNAIKCYPLFSYECDEIGKTYLFYTDYSVDEDGDTRVSVSQVVPDSENPRLVPVTNESELDLLEKILDFVVRDVQDLFN